MIGLARWRQGLYVLDYDLSNLDKRVVSPIMLANIFSNHSEYEAIPNVMSLTSNPIFHVF